MLLSKEPLNNAALSCSRWIYRRKLYWYIPLNSGCTELGVHIHCAWRFSLQSISIRHTPRAAGRFYQMPFRNPIVCPPSDFSSVIAVCPRSQYTIVFSFCQLCLFHSLKNMHFRQIIITHIVQIALSYECNYFHHSDHHDARQSLSYSEGSSFYLSLHWLRGDGHSIKLGLKLFAKNVRQRSSNSNPVLV